MSQPPVKYFPSFVFQGGPFRAALFLCAFLAGGSALAVELPEETEPPTPTETTKDCVEGTVWDKATQECVPIRDMNGDQATLYNTARELAWAGRLNDALDVLEKMEIGDKRLTYTGFVARQSGDWPRAEAAYLAALELNPNNLLARSYYGQGLVARGDAEAAKVQLREIRRRGGRGSWPETALRLALESGGGAY